MNKNVKKAIADAGATADDVKRTADIWVETKRIMALSPTDPEVLLINEKQYLIAELTTITADPAGSSEFVAILESEMPMLSFSVQTYLLQRIKTQLVDLLLMGRSFTELKDPAGPLMHRFRLLRDQVSRSPLDPPISSRGTPPNPPPPPRRHLHGWRFLPTLML